MEVLPGDVIPPEDLPKSTKRQLKLGPGLAYSSRTGSITASTAGVLHADPKKNAIWIEAFSRSGRYIPRPNDLVIGQVHHSSTDFFHVRLSPHSPLAILPHLAFDSVTKKTRPSLQSGDLVYARVCSNGAASGSSSSGTTTGSSSSIKYLDTVELECLSVSPTTGVHDSGLGPLRGGSLADVSVGFARRLMLGSKRGGVTALAALGQRVRFEVAVGRNGRVWINALGQNGEVDVGVVIAVGGALKEVDRLGLEGDEEAQSEVVSKWLKVVGGAAS